MAVGDVQNRFDVGSQIAQAGNAANQNRQQIRPPERQENPAEQPTVNQPELNNGDIILNRSNPAQQINQNAAVLQVSQNAGAQGTRQGEQELLAVNNQTQGAQNIPVQNRPVEVAENTTTARRNDENALLDVNRTENRNTTTAGGAAGENLVNLAVERTAENPITEIENANAAAANVPPRVAAAANALTQENQVGTRLDTFA